MAEVSAPSTVAIEADEASKAKDGLSVLTEPTDTLVQETQEVREKADSTTAAAEEREEDGDCEEPTSSHPGANEAGGGENRVTSSDNGSAAPNDESSAEAKESDTSRKRERSTDHDQHDGRDEKRVRSERGTSRTSGTSRNGSTSRGRSVDERRPEDARSRIEDRRRGRGEDATAAASVEDYVSRADRARVGQNHPRHCVECNLVFVSARSEKLHRDSQRHRAAVEKKRPSAFAGRHARQTPYVCYLCWLGYVRQRELFEHYGDDEHVDRMRRYGVKCLIVDGREEQRGNEEERQPPSSIRDCVVLDEWNPEDEDKRVNNGDKDEEQTSTAPTNDRRPADESKLPKEEEEPAMTKDDKSVSAEGDSAKAENDATTKDDKSVSAEGDSKAENDSTASDGEGAASNVAADAHEQS